MQKRLPKLLMQQRYSWYKHFELAEAALYHNAWSVVVESHVPSFVIDIACIGCDALRVLVQAWSFRVQCNFHIYNLTHILIQSRRAKNQSTLTLMTLTLRRSAHLHQHSMNWLLAWRNKRVHGAVGEPSIWLWSLSGQALESGWKAELTAINNHDLAHVSAMIVCMLMQLQSMVLCCNIRDTSTSDAVHSPQYAALPLFDNQRSWEPSMSKVQGHLQTQEWGSCMTLLGSCVAGSTAFSRQRAGNTLHTWRYTENQSTLERTWMQQRLQKLLTRQRYFWYKQCMLSIPKVTAASIIKWACESCHVPQSMKCSCGSWLLHFKPMLLGTVCIVLIVQDEVCTSRELLSLMQCLRFPLS